VPGVIEVQASLTMALHSERAGAGPRLVMLHGFGQTARCWGPVADDLARDHEVVRLDAPGHGGSSAARADLAGTAGLAARTCGTGVWLGYSMGGRMALHVAVRSPRALRALVLVGATPGIEDDAERAARREQDRDQARRLRSEGVDAFVERWLELPMFAGLPPWARFDDERRRNTAEGLAASLELAGTGSQAPLWSSLAAIDVPVLAVAGADDARYAAIAERMAAAIGPNASVALVPGAGHAAHLEDPDGFLAVLRPWLAEVEAGG
jgi:2-succinyl-6-hydroxy-2,4-cyclohexadiene-1-carboxylate synthase